MKRVAVPPKRDSGRLCPDSSRLSRKRLAGACKAGYVSTFRGAASPEGRGPEGRGYAGRVGEERSIRRVRVRTTSRTVTLPWQSAQDFVARALAAYPTVHPVVEHFRAVGTARPVDLTDPNNGTFGLAVIEAWAAQVGDEALPPGIADLRMALREEY